MIGYNFSYDGMLLSDFNCVICGFDGNDIETVSSGSQLTFNTIPVYNGQKHFLASTSYDECITVDFQICKNPCKNKDKFFTLKEQRDIMRWLNRKEFCELKIINYNEENIYLEGSFNIEKIELADNVIGFQLHFTSNSPFVFGEEMIYIFDIGKDQTYIIFDTSDEIGYIYPDVTITCKESGDLIIINNFDNYKTIISNVSVNERIHMSDMIIESSLISHQKNLMNDFNFHFLRISNTFLQQKNVLSFSLPCAVEIKYRPIRKVGV